MEFNNILETKKMNIIRNTRRTIEKLFLLHRNNKIDKDVFLLKLDKLKDYVNKNINDIIRIQEIIKKRSQFDALLLFLIEHFNHIGCYNSSKLLSSKHLQKSEEIITLSDEDFYKNIKLIIKEMLLYNFVPALDFFKEYKSYLKSNIFPDIEYRIKLQHLGNLCMKKKFRDALIYCNTELKKYPDIKQYLPLFLNNNTKLEKAEKLARDVEISILDIFGLHRQSRLSKRIEYGFVSLKTSECHKNINSKCPVCCEIFLLRDEVPYNRHEQSIILCRGTGKELDDQNQPYAYDNGHVYGIDYIRSKNYLCICPKTGKSSSKYPRVCYFV